MSQMRTVVGYSDVYVPRNTYSIDEYVTQCDISSLGNDLTSEDISAILKYAMGVEKVYTEERKNEPAIFAQMLARYFTATDAKPEEIDFLIYTRGNSIALGDPWSLTDEECINVPYFLQKKFALVNTEVINIEQECAGTLMAMKIAQALINANKLRRILILSGNFFETPEKRLMGGMIVVSDGLGVLEVTTGDTGLAFLDFLGRTEGRIGKVKELSRPENAEYVAKIGCAVINELLTKNGLNINDISMIIPQNISKNNWNYYCQMLGFPRDKVYLENIREGGHMGDVDVIRNITGITEKSLLQPGDYALVYGLGTGTSWNCLLIKSL